MRFREISPYVEHSGINTYNVIYACDVIRRRISRLSELKGHYLVIFYFFLKNIIHCERTTAGHLIHFVSVVPALGDDEKSETRRRATTKKPPAVVFYPYNMLYIEHNMGGNYNTPTAGRYRR